MRRLTQLVVLVAFIFSCGGQWCVLQGIAWIKMIHDYSQVVPFTEAVGMTLSGKYPCAICKAIAEKKAASERTMILSLTKYDKSFLPPTIDAAILLSPAIPEYPIFDHRLVSRMEPPPTPPPRLA